MKPHGICKSLVEPITPLSTQTVNLGTKRNNAFLYNGKEFNDDFGLNWYDYGARFYDAQIARWHSVDPLAEKAYSWTPFRYGFNNPMKYIDLNGLIEWPVKGNSAVNKRDVPGGGHGLSNTVVRTSTYLERRKFETSPHVGIDYRASIGNSLYSLGDGTVTNVGSTRTGGKFISVRYNNGDIVTFRHLDSFGEGISIGSVVFEGQIIGTTGNTGQYYSRQEGVWKGYIPHLHIDAKDSDGNPIDPEKKNYGTVTNREFFTIFGGDYQKSRNAKEIQSNISYKPQLNTAAQDKTQVYNPWELISSWIQQNPNIKIIYE